MKKTRCMENGVGLKYFQSFNTFFFCIFKPTETHEKYCFDVTLLTLSNQNTESVNFNVNSIRTCTRNL